MTKPMSALRRHMIEDMKMRNMSPNSQKVYTYAVANFAAFHGRSPDKLGVEHVREYRLHLIARGLKATSINPIIYALRFFYGTTLRRKEMLDHIPYARREDTLPAVLTPDEVLRLLEAAPDLKTRTALTTIYAAGLRISGTIFDTTLPIWRIGEVLLHAAKLASLIARDPEQTTIRLRALYTGLRGRDLRAWASPMSVDYFGGGRSRSDEALVETTAPVAAVEKELGQLVYPLVSSVFERFGVTGISPAFVGAELQRMRSNRFGESATEAKA
jgi:integrase